MLTISSYPPVMLERALLILTIAGGAAIGVFWPTQRQDKPVATSSAAVVAIARSPDKHYYADAQVNGHPVRFLVDTGSSEIALTEEDARKAGLNVDRTKYEPVGQGASGMVRGQYVELRSIAVGEIRRSNTKAVVVEGASISLLGQPFLDEVDEIVIRKGEIVLRDSPKG